MLVRTLEGMPFVIILNTNLWSFEKSIQRLINSTKIPNYLMTNKTSFTKLFTIESSARKSINQKFLGLLVYVNPQPNRHISLRNYDKMRQNAFIHQRAEITHFAVRAVGWLVSFLSRKGRGRKNIIPESRQNERSSSRSSVGEEDSSQLICCQTARRTWPWKACLGDLHGEQSKECDPSWHREVNKKNFSICHSNSILNPTFLPRHENVRLFAFVLHNIIRKAGNSYTCRGRRRMAH